MVYREGLLAPRAKPKLEDHPLSAVHDCLFNLFAATLHKGGRSSILNLRKRHAVVTGPNTHGIFSFYMTILDGTQVREQVQGFDDPWFHRVESPVI